MLPNHRELQKYLHWSDRMVKDGRRFVDENFPDQKYIGIHLRNGPDWVFILFYSNGYIVYCLKSILCIDLDCNSSKTSLE